MSSRFHPNALSKTSLTFGFSSNQVLKIKDMKSTVADVQTVTIYQIGTLQCQEVVLRAPVSLFLCLVKLPLSKHGNSTFIMII